MFDDCNEDVKVCGFTYPTSMALSELDPVAYRCGIDDYANWLFEDVEEFEEDSDE